MKFKSKILNIKYKNFGFSIIETIIAVAILATLAVASLGSLKTFRNDRLLETTANEAVSVIGEARSKTLNSENSSQYGIHIESFQIVLFKGSAYNQSDAYNQNTALSSLLEIANISLAGGGSDIVFQRLTGKTLNYGSFIVRLKSDASKSKTITIKSTGIAGVQ